MLKGIIITLTITIAIGSLIAFLLTHTWHNRSFSRETNQAIIGLVNQVLDVRYRTHCAETLESILAGDIADVHDGYPASFFRDTPPFVNRNYMRRLHQRSNNSWFVSVRIHEGGLMRGEPFWLDMNIIKTDDGVYLIRHIGLAR